MCIKSIKCQQLYVQYMYYNLFFDLMSSSADIVSFENKGKHKMPRGRDV